MLVAGAVVGVLFAAAMFMVSPFLQHFRSITADQQRIVNDLDHSSIRDAAIPLLANVEDRLIEQDDWPTLIAQTEPKNIHVANEMLVIEYGSGFAHYGLVIDPGDGQFADRTKLTDGVYFYETE